MINQDGQTTAKASQRKTLPLNQILPGGGSGSSFSLEPVLNLSEITEKARREKLSEDSLKELLVRNGLKKLSKKAVEDILADINSAPTPVPVVAPPTETGHLTPEQRLQQFIDELRKHDREAAARFEERQRTRVDDPGNPDKEAAEENDEREKTGRYIDQVLSRSRVWQNESGEWVRLTDPDLSQEKSTKTGVVYESLKSKYLITSSEGEWMKVGETQVKNYLENNRGLEIGNGGSSRAMRECMDFITRKSNVHVATDLAGHGTGIYSFEGKRVLVTSSPKIIRPEQGQWGTIKAVLEGMLGMEQLEYLYGWLKIAYTALSTGDFVPGQMVVFAGAADCGKTMVQSLILTPILGGRDGKPYQYMTGQTSFNSDLFRGKHLIISDEIPATEYKERLAFGASIKNLVAEPNQRYHAKGVDAFMLPPFWRVTLSVNDEPENLMILPPMESSIQDKIMLFRVVRPNCLPGDSGTERSRFATAIYNELPAFVHYLRNEHVIRRDLIKGRFGIRHYINPELALSVEELSTEAALMAMIEQEILHDKSLNDEWEGTAGELASRLTSQGSGVKGQAEKLFKNSIVLGKLLSKLEKSGGAHQGLVTSRISGGVRKFTVFKRYQTKDE